MKTLCRRATLGLLVGLLFTVGCSKAPSGKFVDDSGMITLNLDSGKATMTAMGQSKTGDYTVNGKEITLKVAGGSASESETLTYDPDAQTLTGKGIKFKKSK